MKSVIKRSGKTETFSSHKLYDSIYASCLGVHEPIAIAQTCAASVTQQIETWLFAKNEVTTKDIRQRAGEYLSSDNIHAGYLYLHHHNMR